MTLVSENLTQKFTIVVADFQLGSLASGTKKRFCPPLSQMPFWVAGHDALIEIESSALSR